MRSATALLCALPLALALAGPTRAQTPEALISPWDDAEARSLAELDRARVSVDVAHYNIRSEVFFHKLGELRDRGVQVRIAVDAKNARNPWNTLDDRFEAAGFAITRFENTRHAYAIMHHKFVVIDGARVLTGSYNWNETAQHVNDENMVVLDDPTLVAAYREEFEELLGAPETRGRFGRGARRPPAAVYFAPEDDVRGVLLDLIRGARRRLLVAVFAFKDDAVARALRDAARRGVEVVLVTEQKQADGTRADETVASGGARVIVGANRGSAHSAMHHKFMVVDDTTVVTGACNWTYTAFQSSNEDVLVLDDPALARRYTDAVASLVRRYDPAGFRAADLGLSRPEAAWHLVIDMPRTEVGDTVYVVGDHPALGGWDLARALPLVTTDGIHPGWTGRVRLPAGARVEWKAVVRGPRGDRWELGANRVLETDPDGADAALLTAFRDLVEVEVTATAPALDPGAEVRLVGGDPLLGDWDPALALPLAVDPADPALLRARVVLPGRAWIACKLVVVGLDGSVRWEGGWDRTLAVHDQDGPQRVEFGAFRP